jgi:GT2 family glycosyltransferase
MSGGTGPRAPVAVAIVSWNSARFLDACLASLDALVRRPAEIVVVDSGSTDDSARVASGHAGVTVIARAENVGFCRGTNLGIAATTSPFLLALNPDTALEPRFLEELLPAFDDPAVGLAAGKLLRFDRTTLDSAGQALSRSRRPRDRGYGRPDRGQFDRDEEVFGACGAAALYRRATLEAIADPGGQVFDESFFAFGEDLDVAWRARRLGWRAAYRHRAVGYHARGSTAPAPGLLGKRAALLARGADIRFHVAKNRYLTILRNDTVAGYLTHLPFILARDAALAGLLLATSPGVFLRLWRERAVFREALRRRRLDAGRPRHQLQSR